MKTRCPNCQTTFRVTPEQLKARAGKVRCGQCQTAFNALDSLVETVPSAPTPAQAPVFPTLPVDTEPTLASEPVTREPTQDTDTAENTMPEEIAAEQFTEPSETIADPSIQILLEPTQPTAEPPTTDETPPTEPLSEAEAQELGKATGLILPREMTEVPGYSKWSAGVMAAPLYQEPEKPARWPYVLAAILFSLALLGQAAFRFRGEIAIAMPTIRPVLEGLSQLLDTHIPLPRHVDLVSIEASDLQSDAAHGNLLVLNATVRNRAAYPQAYPSLELSLTDTQDNPIARKVFPPEEYLPARLKADQPFAANADIGVRLWIEAKDVSAAGYRLYVFYP